MSTSEMSKLRGVLQDTVRQLGQAGSVSSGAVIDAVRTNNPEAIKPVSRQLEDGALHRLLSQLATRSPKDDNQSAIFADYPGVRQYIGIEIERDGHRTTEWKLLSKATLRELTAWLATERKIIATRRERNPGMAKLLGDLSRVVSSQDMTVQEALATRAAKKGRPKAWRARLASFFSRAAIRLQRGEKAKSRATS
jgi:hypothetical protein